MKAIGLFIVFLVPLASCQFNGNTVDNKDARQSAPNPIGAAGAGQEVIDDLAGEWEIYDTFDGSTVIYCNQCPTVVFNLNGTAAINFHAGPNEVIKWKRDGQILKIVNVSAKEGAGEFDNGNYLLTFGTEGRLEIKEMTTNRTYGLARHGGNLR